MINELRTLMSFVSVSSDQESVKKLLDYVAARLRNNGLRVTFHELDGVYSIYSSTLDSTKSKVMMQGHVDVVPGDQPFTNRNGKIHGRGSFDMLYAVASFLRLIDEIENIKEYDISILLTGDEELGGAKGAGAVMNEPTYEPQICIMPDAGEGIGSMNVGAKGVYHIQLAVNGKSHHGSRPWEGDGAAAKLVALLSELSQTFDLSSKSNSTLTIAQLSAGNEALNQGPGVASCGLDIRFTDELDFKRIRGALVKLLKQYDGEITFDHIGDSYDLDLDHPLVKKFMHTYRDATGRRTIRMTRAHGSSDARFFSKHNIPVIMFRPDGGGAHGDDEWISINSWETFYKILKAYVIDIARLENKV